MAIKENVVGNIYNDMGGKIIYPIELMLYDTLKDAFVLDITYDNEAGANEDERVLTFSYYEDGSINLKTKTLSLPIITDGSPDIDGILFDRYLYSPNPGK